MVPNGKAYKYPPPKETMSLKLIEHALDDANEFAYMAVQSGGSFDRKAFETWAVEAYYEWCVTFKAEPKYATDVRYQARVVYSDDWAEVVNATN